MLGKAKEKLGDATDNKDLQAEGKNDQSTHRVPHPTHTASHSE